MISTFFDEGCIQKSLTYEKKLNKLKELEVV